MTGQDLKNSILQLAIQGKLVPQDPNDEPASELLKCIRAEKERLVKEKKLKKKDLVTTPISDEEKPFEIPESWEWVRLNNLALVARGGSPRPIKEYITESSNGVNWIKIGDTEKGGKYINSCAEKIKPEGVQRSRMVHPGDFLLTNSMSFGRPYITNVEGCIHDGWLVISQYYQGYDSDFLYYLLSSPYAFGQFSDKTAGAVVQNLNKDKVAESVFPLPPLYEQHRIVAKIDELMPKVEKYDKAQMKLDKLNNELPEQLKQSILQEAIMGKLGTQDPNDEPASELLKRIRAEKEQLVKAKKIKKEKALPEISDEEKPFDIPDSWEWVRLKECSEILYGYPFDSEKFNEFGEGYPLIRIRDVVPGETKTYTTEVVDTRYIVKAGEMLVGMDGNFNVAYWKSSDSYLNQRVCKITARQSLIDQGYLYYYLPIVLEDVCKDAHYVTVKHLSDKHLSNIIIPLPPLAEQHRIVAKLDKLMQKIDKLRK